MNVENLTKLEKKNVCSSVLTTGQLAWVNSRKSSVVPDLSHAEIIRCVSYVTLFDLTHAGVYLKIMLGASKMCWGKAKILHLYHHPYILHELPILSLYIKLITSLSSFVSTISEVSCVHRRERIADPCRKITYEFSDLVDRNPWRVSRPNTKNKVYKYTNNEILTRK